MCWRRDKMVTVITPLAEVTNVAASAAGATWAGLRPSPIGIGARIAPPPIP
jgi:hypothetical protein